MASIRDLDQKHQFEATERTGLGGTDLPSSYKIFDPNDQPQPYSGKKGPFSQPGFGTNRYRTFHQTHQLDTSEVFSGLPNADLANSYGAPVQE